MLVTVGMVTLGVSLQQSPLKTVSLNYGVAGKVAHFTLGSGQIEQVGKGYAQGRGETE